jgi:predicted nucleic acid-binding protein
MKFADANIFIRYLTGDDPAKAAACFDLFQRISAGQEQIMTCEAIVTEIVYVLSSRALYRLSSAEISSRLTPLLNLPGVRLNNKRTCVRALELYGMHARLDFADALCVAYMERSGIEELLSYDQDFDRVPDVRRIQP